MVSVPTHRAPSHRGEMLRREFLEPPGLTQTEPAERREIPFHRVNSLVNGRRGMTPDTALGLARGFQTTPGFWMNHQLRRELFHAQRQVKDALKRIEPVPGRTRQGRDGEASGGPPPLSDEGMTVYVSGARRDSPNASQHRSPSGGKRERNSKAP